VSVFYLQVLVQRERFEAACSMFQTLCGGRLVLAVIVLAAQLNLLARSYIYQDINIFYSIFIAYDQ